MRFAPTTLAEMAAAEVDTIIDVRAPSEYALDHVPGAISLPVLSDDERARVGTIYTQESAFRARKIGAALVARNAAAHIEGPLAQQGGGWRPLVYCWRGGQRSGAFATILAQIGWRVSVLDGGYRTWRRLVSDALYTAPWPGRVVILDGNTGTAKTAVLARLAAAGAQVLDLEGLAAHRGSLLGPTDRPQPSQKAFESEIAQALLRLDPARPLLVEAESSKVGDLLVPPSLWAAMRVAPRIGVSAPAEARAAFLARAYDDIVSDPAQLQARLGLLVPFHGHERVARWQAMAADGAAVTLAGELIALHYDPRYAKSRERKEGPRVAQVHAETLDEAGVARLAADVGAVLERL